MFLGLSFFFVDQANTQVSTICRLTITHHLDWTHQLKNGVISLIIGPRPPVLWVALKVFLVPGANWQKHRKPSEPKSLSNTSFSPLEGTFGLPTFLLILPYLTEWTLVFSLCSFFYWLTMIKVNLMLQMQPQEKEFSYYSYQSKWKQLSSKLGLVKK